MGFDLTERLIAPRVADYQPAPPLIHYWRTQQECPFPLSFFIKNVKGLPPDLSNASVILPQGGEMAARDMLGHGAERVLFADAALANTDPRDMQCLLQALGVDKVGVWLPVRRYNKPCKARMSAFRPNALHPSVQLINSMLPTQSMSSPQHESPQWEVLYADNKRTGVNALWWARQMLDLGVSCILLSVDFVDEADYSLAAALARQCRRSLWLSPLTQKLNEWNMEGWVQQGNIRQFVLDHNRLTGRQ